MTSSRLEKLSSTRILFCLMLLLILILPSCSSGSRGGKDLGDGNGGEFSDEDLALKEREWGDGNIPIAQENSGGDFADIYFDFDSATVRPEFQEALRKDAKILYSNSSLHAEVEGHCDKRGTNEYNLALGEERARSVANLLLSYGARSDQITWISYGEEIPVDPGDSEEAFSKNRRAHFALYRKDSSGRKVKQ